MPIDRFRHDTMTGPEFCCALDRHDMSKGKFSRLTGARNRTIEAWMDDGAPYWVSVFFEALEVHGVRERLEALANRSIMSEAEWQRAREAAE